LHDNHINDAVRYSSYRTGIEKSALNLASQIEKDMYEPELPRMMGLAEQVGVNLKEDKKEPIVNTNTSELMTMY
jgi:hypothetical protein